MSYFLRRVLSISLLSLAMLGAIPAGRAQEARVAVASILDVSGQVMLFSEGNRMPAEVLGRIAFGERMVVARGARVAFLYRPQRVEYTFDGPADLTFNAAGVQVRAGNEGIVRAIPGDLALRLEPNTRTRPEIRAGQPGSISPEFGETVLTNRPLLSWSGAVGREPFELTLTDCGASITECNGTPMSVKVKSTAWRPSEADALEWGHVYRWSVSQGKKARSDQHGWFLVIAEPQLEILAALHPGESRELSRLVIYAQALEEVGARSEARDLWTQLANARPDQRTLMCKAAGRPIEQCRRMGANQ